MKPKEAAREIDKRIKKLQRAIANDLPRVVGKNAVDFYQDNFRLQGFKGDTFKKWKPAKRIGNEKGAAGRYPTLLSRRKELYNSIHFIPGAGKVTIRSDKPYSRIHNEGGTIIVPVTDKMRKWAWANFYKNNTGIRANSKTGYQYQSYNPQKAKKLSFYRGLALTKKKTLTIKIPKRQFMGISKPLNELILSQTIDHLNKVLK